MSIASVRICAVFIASINICLLSIVSVRRFAVSTPYPYHYPPFNVLIDVQFPFLVSRGLIKWLFQIEDDGGI